MTRITGLVPLTALLLAATPLAASAPRCPHDCRSLLKTERKTCRVACPKHGPSHDCRSACVAAFKGDKAVCRTAMKPTPPACGMAITSTSTSTVTTTTSSTTTVPCAAPSVSGCLHDLGYCTILDICTGLEWEKKTTEVGSGMNAADLHDVDNYYNGAGLCSVSTSKHCQPSAAAETACKAQTAPTDWANGGCEQCVEGEGTCNVESHGIGVITTTWQWLSQMNAANYAGHSDWRLPSEDGRNTSSTTNPRELETIQLAPCVSETSPCIDPIFGPVNFFYWSSSTLASALPKYEFTYGWLVSFYVGKDEFGHDESAVWAQDKRYPGSVRAVRGGS